MLSGEKADATVLLRKAMNAGLSPSIVAVDPQFEPMRSEPEFAQLIQKEQ